MSDADRADAVAERIERVLHLQPETIQTGNRTIMLTVDVAETLIGRLFRAEHPYIEELRQAPDWALQLAVQELSPDERQRLREFLTATD